MASVWVTSYIFLYICIYFAKANECVSYNFEDFDSNFLYETEFCNLHRLAKWIVGSYSAIGLESPYANSASFVTPSSTGSCGSTFTFPMTAGGTLEVNVYLESDPSDTLSYMLVTAMQAVTDGHDEPIGNASIASNFNNGWHTLRIDVIGSGSFDGYLLITGTQREESRLLIDSFRYIPPGLEAELCAIYENDIESTPLPTAETTPTPTTIVEDTTASDTTTIETRTETTESPTTTNVNDGTSATDTTITENNTETTETPSTLIQSTTPTETSAEATESPTTIIDSTTTTDTSTSETSSETTEIPTTIIESTTTPDISTEDTESPPTIIDSTTTTDTSITETSTENTEIPTTIIESTTTTETSTETTESPTTIIDITTTTNTGKTETSTETTEIPITIIESTSTTETSTETTESPTTNIESTSIIETSTETTEIPTTIIESTSTTETSTETTESPTTNIESTTLTDTTITESSDETTEFSTTVADTTILPTTETTIESTANPTSEATIGTTTDISETTTEDTDAIEECVTINLETDFDINFFTDNYLCNGFLPWQLDNYTSIDIETPNADSTVFMAPHESTSCLSSYVFKMEPYGIVEANVYMEPVQALDHIAIIAQRVTDKDYDTVAGSITYHPGNEIFVPGWNVIRFTLLDFTSFDGYLIFLGSADQSSKVFIDSVRYIPPSTPAEDASCDLY